MRKYGCATFKVKIGKKIEVKPDSVRYASRPAAGPAAQQQQNIHHMQRSASESTSITKSTKPPATASLRNSRRAPPAPRDQPQPKPYVNLLYGKSTAEHPIYEDESF